MKAKGWRRLLCLIPWRKERKKKVKGENDFPSLCSDNSDKCSVEATGNTEATIKICTPCQETTASDEYSLVLISGSKISHLLRSNNRASDTLVGTDDKELAANKSEVKTTDNILDSRETADISLPMGKCSKKSNEVQRLTKNFEDVNFEESVCEKPNSCNSLVNSSLMDQTCNENSCTGRTSLIQESYPGICIKQSLNFLKPESPEVFFRERHTFLHENEHCTYNEQSVHFLKTESPDNDGTNINLPEPHNCPHTTLKRVVNSEIKSNIENEKTSSTVSNTSESSDDYPTGYPRSCESSYLAKSSLSSQVLTIEVSSDCHGCIFKPLSCWFQKDNLLVEVVGELVMIVHRGNDCVSEDFVEKTEDILLKAIKLHIDHQHDTLEGKKELEEEPFVIDNNGCNSTFNRQTGFEFGQTNVIDNSLPNYSHDKIQNEEHEELVVESNFDLPANANTPNDIDKEKNVAPEYVVHQSIIDETNFFQVQHDSFTSTEIAKNSCNVKKGAEKCESHTSCTDFSDTRFEKKEGKHIKDKSQEMKQGSFNEDEQLSVVQNDVLTLGDKFSGNPYPTLMLVQRDIPLKQVVVTRFPSPVKNWPTECFFNLTLINVSCSIVEHVVFDKVFCKFFKRRIEIEHEEKDGYKFSRKGLEAGRLVKMNNVYSHIPLYPESVNISELDDSDTGKQICLEKELKQQRKKSGKQRKRLRKKKKKTLSSHGLSYTTKNEYKLSLSDSSDEEKNANRHKRALPIHKTGKHCIRCHKKYSHCLCANGHSYPHAEFEENVFEAPVISNQQSLDSGLGTLVSLYSCHSSLVSLAKQKLKKSKSEKTFKKVDSIKRSLLSLEERVRSIVKDFSHFRPVNLDVAIYPGLNSYFERFPSGTTPTVSQQMEFEWLRVSSFGTYTGQGSCINLARNGFYADSGVGLAATRCCKCGVVVSDWEYLDSVADRHRQLSPNCPFVTGRDSEEGNVSIFDEGSATASVSPEPQATPGPSAGVSALLARQLPNAEFTSVASTRSATQLSSSSSSEASSSDSAKSRDNKLTSGPSASKEIETYQPVEDAENLSLPRLGGGARDTPAQTPPPPSAILAPVGAGAFAGGASRSRTGGEGSLLDEGITMLENQLGAEWMLVALNLGITQVDIERTQAQEPHNTRRQIQSIFTRWRRSTAFTDMGKVESLIQALEESGRNDLAEDLKNRRDALRRNQSTPGSSSMPQEGVGNPEFVIVENPKHPNYSSMDARISSFRGWPSTLGQSARQMAAAGFYYAGVSDFTRCFCCGGGLRNWETGDDPVLEHTRWFPNCEYVNRLRGQTYVQRISRRQQEHLATQKKRAEEQERKLAAQRNAPDPLDTAAAQTLLEMGYPPERVRTAITKLRRASGNVTVSADQAVRYLLDEEDTSPATGRNTTQGSIARSQGSAATSQGSAAKSQGSAATSAKARASVTSGPQSLRAGGSSAPGSQGASAGSESQVGSLSSNVSTTAVAGSLAEKLQGSSTSASALGGKDAPGEKRETKSSKKKKKKSKSQPQGGPKVPDEVHGEIDAQSLRVENERLREMHKCKICMERMVDTTILPCGHLVCCGECASKINQCPICRAQIKGTVKTFLS